MICVDGCKFRDGRVDLLHASDASTWHFRSFASTCCRDVDSVESPGPSPNRMYAGVLAHVGGVDETYRC